MTAIQSMGNHAQKPSTSESYPISPDRHRNAEHIADELALTQSFIQAAADALQLLAVPELEHVRQILQFTANKLWENAKHAKALQVDLHQEFISRAGGAV